MSKRVDILAFMSMSSFWALNYPLVKFGLMYEPPLFILFFRVLFGLIFAIILFARNIEFPRGLKTHVSIALLGLFNVVLFMGFWFTAEQTEPSSISSIIVYTYPILAMAFSMLFLGERPNKYRIAGTAFGFAGIVVVFSDQLQITPGPGLIFLIIGAVSWAIGTIHFKRNLSGGNIFAINVFQFLYALPIIGVWAILTEPFSIPNLFPQFTLITLYMGALGTAVAYNVYLYLFKKYDVSSISSYFFTVPALSIVFGFLLLGETNTIFTYGGFALISAGIYFTSRNTRK